MTPRSVHLLPVHSHWGGLTLLSNELIIQQLYLANVYSTRRVPREPLVLRQPSPPSSAPLRSMHPFRQGTPKTMVLHQVLASLRPNPNLVQKRSRLERFVSQLPAFLQRPLLLCCVTHSPNQLIRAAIPRTPNLQLVFQLRGFLQRPPLLRRITLNPNQLSQAVIPRLPNPHILLVQHRHPWRTMVCNLRVLYLHLLVCMAACTPLSPWVPLQLVLLPATVPSRQLANTQRTSRHHLDTPRLPTPRLTLPRANYLTVRRSKLTSAIRLPKARYPPHPVATYTPDLW